MNWISSLLLALALVLPANARQKQPESPEGPPLQALTGCLDQSGEEFVLRDNQNLVILAILEPDGFAKNNFAKHVGNTVTVRGRQSSNEQPPRFKVRLIQQLAEGCAAPNEPDQPKR
jgi:hypothetical protein